MSTRAKVIIAVMLVILTICAIFLTLLSRQNRQNLQGLISSKAENANIVLTAIIEQTDRQYSQRIQSFINYESTKTKEQLIKAFAARDREQLQKLSKPFLTLLQKENSYFATLAWALPDNTAFLRVHFPEHFGDNISQIRPDIVATNRDHRQRSGFATGLMGLQYRVVQPVFYQDDYLGVLQFGINGQVLLDALSKQLKTPAAIAIPNGEYATILPKFRTGLTGPTHSVVSTDPALFKTIHATIDWRQARQTITVADKTYMISLVTSLINHENKALGTIFVALDITAEIRKGQALLRSAFTLATVMIALSFLILYFSYGSLVQKIVDLNLSLARNNRELEQRVADRTQTLLAEIEERKITEEKLQKAEKMEAIGLMAGGVAHDLNNILSGVVSYPELLLMKLPKDSELRTPLAAIHESGLRAAAVVADLLTVARNAAKVREIAQINTIILEYLSSLEGRKLLTLYPGISITTTLAPALANILCSPVHVRKCLMNLVTNAAEALGNSGIITISTENRTISAANGGKDLKAGNYVALIVADDGPGIAAADLEHIFEPFYTKKKMGRSGTGIGLAVVWNAIQDHGGHVSVTSSDQGTTFTLLFPATAAAKPEKNLPVNNHDLQGKGEQILVVDDEPHQRDIATQILSMLGYQVATVASGEEAISYMTANRADLIILDMLMDPGINGCQAYETILHQHPGQKAVIASGFSESAEVKKAACLGAGTFVKKPYTFEELGLAVKKALRP